MKKILVVNVNWLGDVLFSVPALRAIKEGSREDVHLTVMMPGRCRRVLEHNPLVDDIIEFDERVTHRSVFAKIKTVSKLKKRNFDKAIFFHRSFTRIFMCKLAGITEREGYYRKKTGWVLTNTVPSIDKDSVHRVDYFLNLVKQLGYRTKGRKYNFYVTAEDIIKARDLLREHSVNLEKDNVIALHPGANWLPKRWPEENWAKLIELLFKEDGNNIKIVITGTEEDKKIVGKIKEKVANNLDKIGDLTGETTLGELGGVFSYCDILVSGDSGSLHIGCSIKSVPTMRSEIESPRSIGLFGPTDKNLTGPVGTEAKIIEGGLRPGCELPCYDYGCEDYVCMTTITPEEVLKYVKRSFMIKGV